MVSPKGIITGLVVLLVVFEIMTNGYAVLLPTNTAITILGINFNFVVLIGAIIILMGILIELSRVGSWK